MHCIVPCLVMAAGYLTASYAKEPWLVVGALAASFVAFMSMQGPALCGADAVFCGTRGGGGDCGDEYHHHVLRVCGAVLDGRDEGLHGELSGGCRGLVLPCLLAAGTMYVLTRSLARRPVRRPVNAGGGISLSNALRKAGSLKKYFDQVPDRIDCKGPLHCGFPTR